MLSLEHQNYYLSEGSYLVFFLLAVFDHIQVFIKKTSFSRFFVSFVSNYCIYFHEFKLFGWVIFTCLVLEACVGADCIVESIWCRRMLVVQHSNGLHSIAVFIFHIHLFFPLPSFSWWKIRLSSSSSSTATPTAPTITLADSDCWFARPAAVRGRRI